MIGSGKAYIVINKTLEMSAGKVAAQTAHVTARLFKDSPEVPHTVIVLQATGEQIRNLREYCESLTVDTFAYIDEGVNEVPPMSMTALGLAMFDVEHAPDFLQGFELYNNKKGIFKK